MTQGIQSYIFLMRQSYKTNGKVILILIHILSLDLVYGKVILIPRDLIIAPSPVQNGLHAALMSQWPIYWIWETPHVP